MTFLREKKLIENLARPRSRSVTSNITDDFNRTLRVSKQQVNGSRTSQYRKFTTRKTVAFGLTTNVIETENSTRQLQRKVSSSSRSTTPLCTAPVKDTEEIQKSMKNGKNEIEKLREENAELRKTADELRSSVTNLTRMFSGISSRMAEYEARQKDVLHVVAELRRDDGKRTTTKQNEDGIGESSSRSADSRNENQHSSGYSFAVPLFPTSVPDGAAYRKLVDDISALFGAHLKNCQVVLNEVSDLPDLVAENVRVAVGRTQLLMKKRLAQFNQQLERHLRPVPGEKVTTLNDLHGLWSLIEIQLDDICHCFGEVEESRLRGWKAPLVAPKPALTTASSMPSLRLHQVQPKNGGAAANSARTLNGSARPFHKMSADETSLSSMAAATAESLAREKTVAAAKRRQDENRRRQEFIRAKRAELSTGANNVDIII